MLSRQVCVPALSRVPSNTQAWEGAAVGEYEFELESKLRSLLHCTELIAWLRFDNGTSPPNAADIVTDTIMDSCQLCSQQAPSTRPAPAPLCSSTPVQQSSCAAVQQQWG